MGEIPDWTAVVTAVATAVGAAVILLGGCFTLRQIRGLKEQTSLSALAPIFSDFQSVQLRKDRQTIYMTLPDDPNSIEIASELYNACIRVLNSFNRIGYLTRKGLIPLDRDLAMYIGPPAMRIWDKLEKLVLLERDRRKEITFACFFEQLVKGCKKKLPEYKVTYFDTRPAVPRVRL